MNANEMQAEALRLARQIREREQVPMTQAERDAQIEDAGELAYLVLLLNDADSGG